MAIASILMRTLINCTLFTLVWFWAASPIAAADTVLLIKSEGTVFREVVEGIRDEIDSELTIVDAVVDDQSEPAAIKTLLLQHRPQAVVLIGNKAANQYAVLQAQDKTLVYPPSIITAALFVDALLPSMQQTVGIRYEIPAISTILAMRPVLKKPINKVGVIYRQWMQPIIKENKQFLTNEQVELVEYQVGNKPKNTNIAVKKGIRYLLKNQVDAVWVINDNLLLNPNTISRAWKPRLQKARIPVLVGVESLIATKLQFGNLATVPDLYSLGTQTGAMVFDLMDNDWQVTAGQVEQPISIKKSINR
ncbi:MAG: hypothetical protein AAFZ92_07550, partial [Pseudomonadota bacterium]